MKYWEQDMKRALGTFVLTLVMLLTGCSAIKMLSDDDPRNDLAITVAVQYTTMKVIENGSDTESRAQRIIDILDDAKRFIMDHDQVAVEEIKEQIQRKIPYEKLDSADTLLINTMLNQLSFRLSARVNNGSDNFVDPEMLVSLNKIHSTITKTASLYVNE